MAARERLRRSYRPKRVRILFIGESPPASGRFFYQADSGLYRAIREAFLAGFPTLRHRDFLASFRDLGCYLVDLCPEPVDRLTNASRGKARRSGELSLSKTIRKLRAPILAVLLRSIAPNVRRAAQRAHWSGQPSSSDIPAGIITAPRSSDSSHLPSAKTSVFDFHAEGFSFEVIANYR